MISNLLVVTETLFKSLTASKNGPWSNYWPLSSKYIKWRIKAIFEIWEFYWFNFMRALWYHENGVTIVLSAKGFTSGLNSIHTLAAIFFLKTFQVHKRICNVTYRYKICLRIYATSLHKVCKFQKSFLQKLSTDKFKFFMTNSNITA